MVTPFRPEACPNPLCPRHEPDEPAEEGQPFFRYKGTFRGADGRLVRRVQCVACGRHFSEQTFRPDFRARRPDLDPELARLHAEGLSRRAIARLLGVSRGLVARRLAAGS